MSSLAALDEELSRESALLTGHGAGSMLQDVRQALRSEYIDVAFEVGRYGGSRRIEILDAASNVTDADKTSLVRLIQSSRFRPRVTDGEFARSSPVVLRYYFID